MVVFTFSPEVKVYLLIDSLMAHMQSTETILGGITCADILSMHSCSAALAFISFLDSPIHASVHILFRLPHFARVISFKEN